MQTSAATASHEDGEDDADVADARSVTESAPEPRHPASETGVSSVWSDAPLVDGVAGEGDKRTEALQIAGIFKAKIVDVDRRTLTLRVVGTNDKLEALLELLQPLDVLEVVRTRTIAMGRGKG